MTINKRRQQCVISNNTFKLISQAHKYSFHKFIWLDNFFLDKGEFT